MLDFLIFIWNCLTAGKYVQQGIVSVGASFGADFTAFGNVVFWIIEIIIICFILSCLTIVLKFINYIIALVRASKGK